MNGTPDKPNEPNAVQGPAAPQGAETILDVLAEAKEAGYTVQQIARDGGRIECTSCDQLVASKRFEVDHIRRLEGASDAADMMLMAWAPCPSCGAMGVLILGYGPNAGHVDSAVLADLDISHADSAPITPHQ